MHFSVFPIRCDAFNLINKLVLVNIGLKNYLITYIFYIKFSGLFSQHPFSIIQSIYVLNIFASTSNANCL